MAKQEYDFVGWATKNDIRCSDGRTIRHNAFIDNDGKRVPLVWNHNHNDIDNVLGYAILKNADDGVRAYGFFNPTDKGRNAKTILEHGDITSLSIYANKLKQVGGDVIHGDIKEVSLVLAGANPGAYIDEIRHGEDAVLDAIILSTGEEVIIEHGEIVEEPEEIEEVVEEVLEEAKEAEPVEETIEHADDAKEQPLEELAKEEPAKVVSKEVEVTKEEKEVADNNEKTVQDVIDSMTEEQKNVMYALVGMAVEDAKGGKKDDEGDEEDMKHNFFANDEDNQDEMIHGEIFEALNEAKRYGSVKESFLVHGLDPKDVLVNDSLSHSITDVGLLYPEYRAVSNDIPFINTNPNGWVAVINNGVHHTPFAKVKMLAADISLATARAKGYVKGNQKVDEIFKMLKRTVDPTTIYKKQSFDRDDAVDITDIDAVAWIKKEMRMKLDEERARAYIFGDGRTTLDPDKIDESKIIPVCKDTEDNLYAMAFTVTPAEGEELAHAVINAMVKGMDDYEGSGNITAFVKSDLVSDMLLMEDKMGQRLYKTMNELAAAMSVDKIVKVPASVIPSDTYAVALDLADYNVGANKGGEVSLFDDFDIDYNKMKYLIETRCSGALILPHSAVVLKAEGSSSL